jgi:hypothetical protein
MAAQPAVFLFDTVTVVNTDAQVYAVVGALGETETTLALSFGRSSVLRTTIDTSTETLSALLIQA